MSTGAGAATKPDDLRVEQSVGQLAAPTEIDRNVARLGLMSPEIPGLVEAVKDFVANQSRDLHNYLVEAVNNLGHAAKQVADEIVGSNGDTRFMRLFALLVESLPASDPRRVMAIKLDGDEQHPTLDSHDDHKTAGLAGGPKVLALRDSLGPILIKIGRGELKDADTIAAELGGLNLWQSPLTVGGLSGYMADHYAAVFRTWSELIQQSGAKEWTERSEIALSTVDKYRRTVVAEGTTGQNFATSVELAQQVFGSDVTKALGSVSVLNPGRNADVKVSVDGLPNHYNLEINRFARLLFMSLLSAEIQQRTINGISCDFLLTLAAGSRRDFNPFTREWSTKPGMYSESSVILRSRDEAQHG